MFLEDRSACCSLLWTTGCVTSVAGLGWGIGVDPVDKRTETSLHDAARSGQLSVAKLLVERGADVRLKDNFGQTASDGARSEGREDMAEWLDEVISG